MTVIQRAFLTVALLVSLASGVYAGEINSPVTDRVALGAEQWTKYDWNASAGKNSKASFEVSDGKQGGLLHIKAAMPDDARFVRELNVEPNSVYRFACQIRTENIGSAARGAGISVFGILEGSRDIKGTSEAWQSVDFYGKTGADQRKLSVTLGVGGYGSLNNGSAWFKDITVEKVTNIPTGVQVAMLEPQAPSSAVPATRSHSGGKAVAALGFFGLLLLVGGFVARRSVKAGESEPGHSVPVAEVHKSVNKNDMAVMFAMSAICIAVSLFNLGGHAAPETGWQSAKAGETITFELGREADLSRFYYYSGINDVSGDKSRFTLAARDSAGTFVPLVSFNKEDVGVWKFSDINIRTSAIRLTADIPGGRLNEIAVVEKGSRTPLTGLRVADKNVSAADQGKPENLIDEQAAFEYAPSFRTGFYFDEIYHARSAWEILHQIEPYESTHPPLGKLLISSGIAIFGMNPFGWRIVGALFGVALVPLMYLFGLKLFRDRFYAFCAAFLMMFEFMRFAQSRVAVIDVFGVFFILVMYYFILDLFPKEGERSQRSTNVTLLLAGVAFGIGAACKWIAVYAGGGMALLVVLRTIADLKQRDLPLGSGTANFLLRRIGVCLITFAVVPIGIYLLAHLPYLALPGQGHDLAGVFRLQEHMLNYHRTLHATHPFSSPWWSWPLDLHPMWMYTGAGLPAGTVSTIASFGNPAIFWLFIPAVAAAAFIAVRRRDARMGVVLTALVFQYLPWVGINRLAFIYHFFSTVPFAILCIVATLKSAESGFPRFRVITWGYLVITAGLFILFYPVLSGLPVPEAYVAGLKWLPTWIF